MAVRVQVPLRVLGKALVSESLMRAFFVAVLVFSWGVGLYVVLLSKGGVGRFVLEGNRTAWMLQATINEEWGGLSEKGLHSPSFDPHRNRQCKDTAFFAS